MGDFIDEPAVMGRVLYRRRQACETEACPAMVTREASYDAQRRLTGLAFVISGLTISAEVYSSWDAQGRPTTGSRVDPAQCIGLPMVIEYDDAARRVTNRPTGPGSGLSCLGVTYETEQTYDANGNLIVETTAVGGTRTGRVYTIESTATLCK